MDNMEKELQRFDEGPEADIDLEWTELENARRLWHTCLTVSQ